MVVPKNQADKVIEIAKQFNISAQVIGRAVEDAEKKIIIPSLKVVGKKDKFYPMG